VAFFRLGEVAVVVFEWPVAWFVPAFCLEEGFPIDRFVTVVDLCDVIAPFSCEGFATDLLVTGVVDLLFVTELLPSCGFVTDLLVTLVVVDLLTVGVLFGDG
jgi:hypothetical protein